MSFWDESSDILCKGPPKGRKKKVFLPRPDKSKKLAPRERKAVSKQEAGSTFTPETGHDAGRTFRVVSSTSKPVEGIKDKKVRESMGFKAPKGTMGYKTPPSTRRGRRVRIGKIREKAQALTRPVSLSGKRVKESVSDIDARTRPTSSQVKEQYEEASPGFGWGDLFNFTGQSSTPYPKGIPDLGGGQAKFRNAVKANLLDRQHRFKEKLNLTRLMFGSEVSPGLSQKGKIMKQMLDRLPARKRAEIMDTYSKKRLIDMARSDQPQLAGLFTRFQTPDAYKKLGGFYFNPTVLEVARHERDQE
jgi:hypothetical protein